MIKFLPIAIVIILVVTVLSVRFILWDKFNQKPPLNPIQTGVLESTKNQISKTLNTSGSTSATINSGTLEDRIKDLESQVHDLKYNLGSTPSAIASKPSTQFISLGSGGSSSALDYSTIQTYQVTLDPADFPGYSGFILELSLSVYQGNGTAYARLIDSDDGLAVSGSEISTSSQNPVWLSSSSFKLLTGKKIYKIQLKTTTSYQAIVENARLRVTY